VDVLTFLWGRGRSSLLYCKNPARLFPIRTRKFKRTRHVARRRETANQLVTSKKNDLRRGDETTKLMEILRPISRPYREDPAVQWFGDRRPLYRGMTSL
jgi:hypothetical protein